MPKGIALAIGLNSVDPVHYSGWSGPLNACEADADDMAAIARSRGFEVKTLLTKAATRNQVAAEMDTAARALKTGDIFMLSYSGHGGQLPDRNGDEFDAQDETWCLYDGEQVDDELYAMLAKFVPGVRILVFSDSCHSGSVVKLAYYRGLSTTQNPNPNVAPGETVYRAMPPEVALRTYRDNREFYDPILKSRELKKALASVKASVLLISGCQDNQLSADGDFNGLFTAQLLRVWNDGAFKGSYQTFHRRIVRLMPPDQTPNLYRTGRANLRFEAQQPFRI
jgi:metacaspase-1